MTVAAARSFYLVRHAIAAERGPAYPDDSRRPLTPRGVARMRAAARGFQTLAPALDLVLTSPLTRALETAAILTDACDEAPTTAICDALKPGQNTEAVARALAAHRSARAVALVGHEPDLGHLAAWLLGANSPLPFRKGGIARIDIGRQLAAGLGQLIWFATPKMLRAMGA